MKKIYQDLLREKIIYFLQPIVQIVNKENNEVKTIGYELLVRLKHKNKLYTPDKIFNYITHKDKSYIAKLNIIQIIKMQKATKDVFFTVNISPQDIKNGVGNLIKRLLKHSKLDSSRIIFEITEDEALNDAIYQKIYELKKYGAIFALDDFGDGYSTFTYFSKYHNQLKLFDYVKIDGELIRYIDENKQHQEMLTHLIQILKNFDFKIIAEYIDTKAKEKILQNLKVDFMQGFLYSPPKFYKNFI